MSEAFDKLAWQRRKRAEFKAIYGYSTTSNERCGGIRQAVLERDGYACVKCGMTDAEHRIKWDRPITVDHKDKNRKHNTMENLQTLCLSCHGAKDLTPRLREQKFVKFKDEAIQMRQSGCSYQKIADRFGFSTAIPWKWLRIWEAQ